MNQSPLITAVVINWNGARDLERELPSLTSQTYEPLEILIIDNGSTDNSAEVVRSFPQARWVPLGSNLGFAGALNEGVRLSNGELVLLLNNDMRFSKNFIEEMAKPLIEDKTIFASDALQYNWDGKNIIHAATFLGSRNDRVLVTLDKVIPGFYIRQEMREKVTPVLMASGSNLMVRKKLFLELGCLDNRYPIGYEDTDICWRAWIRGWRTVFVPFAVCWHNVSRSTKISPEGARFRRLGTIKGRLIFCTKLLPARYVALVETLTVLGCVKDVLLLRWSRFTDRISIFLRHVGQMSVLWRERNCMYRKTKTTPSIVWNRLSSLGG